MSLTGVAGNARGNIRVSISRSNVLTLELRQQASIGLVEGTRATKTVDLTVSAKVRGTLSVGAGVRGSEELAINGVLDGGSNILENITLSKDVTTLADLEGVAGVVVPVVVDLSLLLILSQNAQVCFKGRKAYSVQQGVTLDLRRAATGVVDVVTLQSDQIVVAVEVDAPVVVAVAGGGVVGFTVDEGVGDGDAVVFLGSEDDVLATNALGLYFF